LSARPGMLERMKRRFRKWLGVEQRTIFDAATTDRLLADWISMRGTADDELRWSLAKMRARARDLERNNGIARHFLRALATNVIGPCGFKHSPRVRDNSGDLNKQINAKISEAWDQWCADPLIDGRMSLNGASRLWIKSVARDGELLIRMWRGRDNNRFQFALEPIDVDQLDETLTVTKGGGMLDGWPVVGIVHMGIEMDETTRKPIAYWVWSRPDDTIGIQSARKRLRIPANECIYLYDPDRIGQTRAPSWLVAAMIPLRHLNGYIESELVAARVSAAKMMFFQQRDSTYGSATPAAGNSGFMTEAQPGQFGIVPPGYEVADWSPDHPSTAFGEFVKGGMRQVATALGMSYNALGNDLEGVNYSSMRSGLLVERDYWRTCQDWWRDRFLIPVYTEWLRMAVLSGELVLDSRDFRKFLAVKFAGRGWPWVDPLKDMEAGILGVQSGLASRTQLLAETGQDYEEVIEELAEEKRIAADYDVEIDGPSKVGPSTAAGETDAGDAGDAADGKQPGRSRFTAEVNGHKPPRVRLRRN